MDQIQSHADGDCRVGDIENRPNAEIQKINDRPEPDAVDPIAERPSQDKRQGHAVQAPSPRPGPKPVPHDRKNDNAGRNRKKKNPVETAEKAEGNAGVVDQRQMKNRRDDGKTLSWGKPGEHEGLDELINSDNAGNERVKKN